MAVIDTKSQLGAAAILGPLLSERAILLSEISARALISKASELCRISQDQIAANWNKDGIAKFQPQAGGIAVIPVYGILTKQAQWYDDYIGCCSAEKLSEQLTAAMADDGIEDIVLDIDSPGGFVNGPVEFADSVKRANEIKTVTAVVRGMCCSGAYWLASQCDSIISRRECEVGNIGVYTVLADVSKFYSEIGVDLTVVASGQFKGLGADGKVNEDLLSDTKRIINGLFQQFVSAVASGRGMTLEQAMEVSDGRAFLGAQAMKLGLVDEVVTSFDEAMQSIVGARPQEGSVMKKTTKEITEPKAEDVKPVAPVGVDAFVSGIASADAFKAGTTTTVTVESAPVAAKKKGDDGDEMDDEEVAKKEDDCDDEEDEEEMEKKEKKGGKKKGQASEPVVASAPGAAVVFTPSDYISAFGDIGARWFYEGKTFQSCTIQFIEKMKTEHKSEIVALQEKNHKLSEAISLVDRGNESASASVDSSANPPGSGDKKAVTMELANKMGSVPLATFVNGIADSPAFKNSGKSHQH